MRSKRDEQINREEVRSTYVFFAEERKVFKKANCATFLTFESTPLLLGHPR